MSLDQLNQFAAERRDAFLDAAVALAPGLVRCEFEPLITQELICPWNLQLSNTTLDAIKSCIRSAFELRQNSNYQDALRPEFLERKLHPVRNSSLFMSYDFHIRPDGSPALIEINTNASFLGLSFALYKSRGWDQLPHAPQPPELLEDLKTEISSYPTGGKPPFIQICDEAPQQQKIFSEFLFFKNLFSSWGWRTEIVDISEVSREAQLIYNRSTDFYLASPASSALRSIYESDTLPISPGPNEYFYLADKQRMIDWSISENFDQWRCPDLGKQLRASLLTSRPVTSTNAEAIWSDRKKLFLKPMRMFGSKQSYRGASISRKAFDQMIDQGFIAQELCPAFESKPPTEFNLEAYKFDLRVYAYQGAFRGAVARFYQGQVTNTRTPFGGFSPVQWGGTDKPLVFL